MKKMIIGVISALTITLTPTVYAETIQAHGYMIANYEIKDQKIFQQYMEAAGPLAPKYNGKIIVFNTKAIAIEGAPKSVMAIAEFPSLADAQRFYHSPEYAKARKLRIASTQGTVVITEGYVSSK
jgi:uncharacterized protein (DUF1330 family)